MYIPLFVYGTLKRGFHNFDSERAGNVREGKFHTMERFPLHITGKWRSPVLINEPGQGHKVAGEIHDVTIEQLIWLDEFESTHLSSGYDRIKIYISGEDGALFKADAYVKPRARIDIIHGEPLEIYPQDADYILPSERG
ncbi:MAG: gamma-glutamylcyclotransferase [Rhizobiales bacterium]|nr:gamma-glutamylcyclotransferase [Hyphomicrobiales bacterium]